jgi:hypothetical protein
MKTLLLWWLFQSLTTLCPSDLAGMKTVPDPDHDGALQKVPPVIFVIFRSESMYVIMSLLSSEVLNIYVACYFLSYKILSMNSLI